MNDVKRDFEYEKTSTAMIAKELGYGKETMERLLNATSSYELDRIMMAARKEE